MQSRLSKFRVLGLIACLGTAAMTMVTISSTPCLAMWPIAPVILDDYFQNSKEGLALRCSPKNFSILTRSLSIAHECLDFAHQYPNLCRLSAMQLLILSNLSDKQLVSSTHLEESEYQEITYSQVPQPANVIDPKNLDMPLPIDIIDTDIQVSPDVD